MTRLSARYLERHWGKSSSKGRGLGRRAHPRGKPSRGGSVRGDGDGGRGGGAVGRLQRQRERASDPRKPAACRGELSIPINAQLQ